jgi:hypothetical protein
MPLLKSNDDFVVGMGLEFFNEIFALQTGNAINTKLTLRDALLASIKIINRSYLKPLVW